MNTDIHHKVLKLLEENPTITQRELSEVLGVSLGKVNYCLRALVSKGWVKINNLKNSNNKRAYAYVLTPAGLESKINLTVDFLRKKMNEYEDIRTEIEELKKEVGFKN